MTRQLCTSLLTTGLIATVLIAGGCSSTITSSDLRKDWSPELYSVAQSEEQYYNSRTIRRNNTWRQIADDWSMIWLENRNLRMTKYTLP